MTTSNHTALTQALNENICWQAVQNRDAAYDGRFLYGVISTGVYCHPSCHSRQPRRENVRFFAVSALARAAGFRACKRCRPGHTQTNTAAADARIRLAEKICALIDQQLRDGAASPHDLRALGAETGVSPFHMQRQFKKVTGITPRQYAEARRAAFFKMQVRNGHSVTAALYDAGFGSGSRLYEKSDDLLGMTPATYQKGGKGMQIQYSVVPCPLGRLLAAVTDRGICSVTLGDTEEQLARDLHAEFPGAAIARAEAPLRETIKAILAHLEGKQPALNLPLDVRATAFQKRVWDELRRIPYGETASYTEIARRLDQPTAARAVARA
ncbi:MAG: bifunctional transcriptional activator/DNA repair enzyme AdaA, partial [Blastocatellia bacterium]